MLRRFDLTLDCADAVITAQFWRTAAGYLDEPPPAPFTTRAEWLASVGEEGDDERDGAWLYHPDGLMPRMAILRVPEPKTAKNRLHLDLRVSGDGSSDERWAEVQAEKDRLLGAGASVAEEFAPHHVVMLDPEGNEFCIA